MNHHAPGFFWWQIDDNALFLYHNGTSVATTAYLEWGTCRDKTCITKHKYVSSAQCYKNLIDRSLKFSPTLSYVLLLLLMQGKFDSIVNVSKKTKWHSWKGHNKVCTIPWLMGHSLTVFCSTVLNCLNSDISKFRWFMKKPFMKAVEWDISTPWNSRPTTSYLCKKNTFKYNTFCSK